MKNTFGTNLSFTLFGESHGMLIGGVLDGLPAGISIDLARIEADMNKRKAAGSLSTRRHEEDAVHLVSGFFEGKTTGSPLTIVIENKSQRSGDYAALKSRLRPGHADFAAFEKYSGYQDYRGGGHFSGRLTAPVVAAGSICMQILEQHGVRIASHIEQLYNISDVSFSDDPSVLSVQMRRCQDNDFAVLDPKAGAQMKACIEQAAADLDSVGGILETIITGLPAGIGEPFFDSVESTLSRLLFSVPAVKGVSFGAGFGFALMKGSQANDPFFVTSEGSIATATNNNAGINGGITNGMPIRIHTCIKPTPSIYLPQQSADYLKKENVTLQIKGRHDPAIIHRARIVADSVCAIGLLDLWMARQGTLYFQAAPAACDSHEDSRKEQEVCQ